LVQHESSSSLLNSSFHYACNCLYADVLDIHFKPNYARLLLRTCKCTCLMCVYVMATKSGPKIRNLCLKGSLQTAQKPSHAHHAHSRFQFYNFCSEQGISIAKFCFLEFNLHMPSLHLLPENGMDHVSYTQCVCCKLHLNFNYLWVGFQVM